MEGQPQERIGLVLAGGGARGAYEIGVLSALLPELERRGQRPAVIVGTSVGAINAAFVAATAHLPAVEAMSLARERWLGVEWNRILKPILGRATAFAGARYAGAVLGLPGAELRALLDPAPLGGTLAEWIDWEALHRNTRSGLVESLAVAATSAMSARSMIFLEGDNHNAETSHEVDYTPTEIGIEHVLASAAIPLAFPAVRIEHPAEAEGYYYDGGTRLNTPIKPALDLEVDRVIVIATHSVNPRTGANWHVAGKAPDFGDGLVQLLFATLVDSLIADMRMLGKINLLLEAGPHERADEFRRSQERTPHRIVPYMFIAPSARDRVGDLAERVFADGHRGLRGLARSRDLATLGRLLGGITEPHAELLSYLLFTPEFSEALIEQGEHDARDWIDRDWGQDGPWMVEPIEALG